MPRLNNPIGLRAHTSTHRAALGQWPGSNQDKYEAASVACEELSHQGIESCIFGSLGCKLYGVDCKPHDVDMIILDDGDIEELKRLLVRGDPRSRFYLLPPRDPNATYRVLWYATNRGARVKVDILQPGTLSIPEFDGDDIVWIRRGRYSLPVSPFAALLLLKLQGWDHHRGSGQARYYEKHYTDVDHIYDLLEIGVDEGEDFDVSFLPIDFVREGQERVYSFVQLHPSSEDFWSSLGFRSRKMRSAILNSRSLLSGAAYRSGLKITDPRLIHTYPRITSARYLVLHHLQSASHHNSFTATRSIQSSASHKHRDAQTVNLSENEREVFYRGPLSTTFKNLKLFSLTSLTLASALTPFIFIIDAPLSLSARIALAAAALGTSASSTALISWCGKPYVISMRREPGSDTIELMTTDIFLRERRTTVLDPRCLQPTSRPFATWEIPEVFTADHGSGAQRTPGSVETITVTRDPSGKPLGECTVKWGEKDSQLIGTLQRRGQTIRHFNVHEELLNSPLRPN